MRFHLVAMAVARSNSRVGRAMGAASSFLHRANKVDTAATNNFVAGMSSSDKEVCHPEAIAVVPRRHYQVIEAAVQHHRTQQPPRRNDRKRRWKRWN